MKRVIALVAVLLVPASGRADPPVKTNDLLYRTYEDVEIILAPPADPEEPFETCFYYLQNDDDGKPEFELRILPPCKTKIRQEQRRSFENTDMPNCTRWIMPSGATVTACLAGHEWGK